MSRLLIWETTLQDEAALLRLMRNLAEQVPGAIRFCESAARAAVRKFLSLPALGGIWILCEEN
jgi:hypothetical protein